MEVVLTDALYFTVLRRLGAWWSVGYSCISPERVVTASVVEAWL
jgi:hypothetical protein